MVVIPNLCIGNNSYYLDPLLLGLNGPEQRRNSYLLLTITFFYKFMKRLAYSYIMKPYRLTLITPIGYHLQLPPSYGRGQALIHRIIFTNKYSGELQM